MGVGPPQPVAVVGGTWRAGGAWAVGTGACRRAPRVGVVAPAGLWRGLPRLGTGAVATAAVGGGRGDGDGGGGVDGGGGSGGSGGGGGGGRFKGVGAPSLEAAVDRLTAIHLAVVDTRGHHARVSADLLTVQSHSLLLEAMTEDMETMATLLLEGVVGGMGSAEVARAAATADGVADSLRLMAADMVGAGKDGTTWLVASPPALPPPAEPGSPYASPAGGRAPFSTTATAAAATGTAAHAGTPPSFPVPVPLTPAAVAARLCDAVDAFRIYRRRYLRPVCDDTVEVLRQSAVALRRGDTVLAQTAAALDMGDKSAARVPGWTPTTPDELEGGGRRGVGAPDGTA